MATRNTILGAPLVARAQHLPQVACIDLVVKAAGDLNAQDIRRQTALHAAALFGYDDVIKNLMAHNAHINAKADAQWHVSCRRHDSRPNQ